MSINKIKQLSEESKHMGTYTKTQCLRDYAALINSNIETILCEKGICHSNVAQMLLDSPDSDHDQLAEFLENYYFVITYDLFNVKFSFYEEFIYPQLQVLQDIYSATFEVKKEYKSDMVTQIVCYVRQTKQF
jgi:hypothetical protein